MLKKIMGMLSSKMTKDFTETPLMSVAYRPKRRRLETAGDLQVKVHPQINDPEFQRKVNELVEHIKKTYDSQNMSSGERKVLLIQITFNLKKYKEAGEMGSCDVKVLKGINDEKFQCKTKVLIDHIRANYNMKELCK